MSKSLSAEELYFQVTAMDYLTREVCISIIEEQFDAIREEERQACADRWCIHCKVHYNCAICMDIKIIKGELNGEK